MNVRKSDGSYEEFDRKKLINIVKKVFKTASIECNADCAKEIVDTLYIYDGIMCSSIRKQLQERFLERDERLLTAYLTAKEKKNRIKDFVNEKKKFIEKYKESDNTANATVDDNSNVSSKNIGILNAEIHKPDNIEISRAMVMDKIKELYPNFSAKNYLKDLASHIIYKHDESSFAGAISPYCVSLTMYPFLTNGIKRLGGLSAAPKNIDSFCGMFINLIFATASQFAGAVATPEFLLYFTYFAKKEWGDDFWKSPDTVVTINTSREKTIRKQIRQYFQQVVYSVNQPAAARGMQSAFWNVAYFDKLFFDGMFGDFYFPDGEKPDWESLAWIQQEFMRWLNEERTRCILTFPVESFALVFKDGKFQDEESAKFVAEEYARGHSFFTYISDTVDSLSSCCRLKNKLQTKEFNFTNGNMGVQTGSKSVITLNLNRIIQDWFNNRKDKDNTFKFDGSDKQYDSLNNYLNKILERVYKYHTAYNELLWDMYDAKLLPVYKAGFIDLNKQYLTIGINGLNQAAEFLGLTCRDNDAYSRFCQKVFGNIKDQNNAHKVTDGKHKITFNTECVPAESLAIKNYNWDKEDGYWVPKDTNLYASYIYKPNDKQVSMLEKIRLHGANYIGEYLDGGSACHLNASEHLSEEQYAYLLRYAAENGCQYLTWNIPNCECEDCHYISKTPFDVCPRCGSKNVALWDRIIGYLTKINNWSAGRQIEQKTRVYEHVEEGDLC
jgi:ribonucleoside-triphosphate reductase